MISFSTTPHFTLRVWGSVDDETTRRYCDLIGKPLPREVLCDIEIDQTEPSLMNLTVKHHRGMEVINQKMLTRGSDVLPD